LIGPGCLTLLSRAYGGDVPRSRRLIEPQRRSSRFPRGAFDSVLMPDG
jgi:hypothetical protein